MHVKRRSLVLAGTVLLLMGLLAGCASPEEATEPNLEDDPAISAGEDDFPPGAAPEGGLEEDAEQQGELPEP